MKIRKDKIIDENVLDVISLYKKELEEKIIQEVEKFLEKDKKMKGMRQA